MINVKRFGFNTTRANCYVVSDETKECVIIDPCALGNYERELLLKYIHDEQLKPVRCLLTHGHYDHLLSCDLVRDEFGLLPEVHNRDNLWINRIEMKIEEVFGEGGFKYEIVKPEHYLKDFEVIHFGSHHLMTLHTPGHSPGSVVYYCEKEHIAFTGDTLFRKSIGRSDLLFGYIEDLMNSLKYITKLLPDDCVIYPGHDLESTIGYEKKHNPYLLPSWYKEKINMKHLVVFTGAGISKESGLATFRDEDGLWTHKEWESLAHKDALINETQKCLDFYNWRRKQLAEVEPNHAHKVLAELEKDYNVSIITQNVDNLHERAGSTHVIHLHGELSKVCSMEERTMFVKEYPLTIPIRVGDKADDGSQLRPYIVMFGEYVDKMNIAVDIAKEADIFVIIGTSLNVYPAAGLKESVPWKIPCFIIDPGEFWAEDLYGFEHIKTTAVAGVDILREKLAAL